MNKADLVKQISDGAGVTRKQAADALDSFFAGVAETLKKGKSALFVGFGSFRVVKRAARKGRNPRTGGTMEIPAKKVVRFAPGKKLKDIVS